MRKSKNQHIFIEYLDKDIKQGLLYLCGRHCPAETVLSLNEVKIMIVTVCAFRLGE